MKRLAGGLAAFGFLFLMCGASCEPDLEDAAVPGDLVFEDDFDSDPVAQGRWNYEYGTGSQYGLSGWGNNEQQYYTPDNVYARDGILYIEAKKNDGGHDYTSARITTGRAWKENGDAQPLRQRVCTGRVEARIKSPAGRGFWPAFWLVGLDSFNGRDGAQVVPWPRCGEVDILEIKGDNPHKVYSTIHYGESYPSPYGCTGGEYTHSESLAAGWHNYGVVWDRESINFTFDGEVTKTIVLDGLEGGASWAHPETFADEAGFGIILNLAIGGNFIGGQLPDASAFSGPLENRCLMVDWVRVYQ